ncbi:cupin domain-containing protein [Parasphaerochaeta coccoides]|uniref:cupin domain-containing protein n=1 Tax=Parasphaerochaeta coccoides TaxID=273376 RepID=UPI001C07B560|nr:cupin domain-containing protein [Parasphaerochaeta coccoides]
MNASDVISRLGLEPLEGEGGYFRPLSPFLSPQGEKIGSGILYLMTTASWSSLHLLSADESWHFAAGDPVEQLLLEPDGSWSVRILGADIMAGHIPAAMVEKGRWQGSRPYPGGEAGWSLCTAVMCPPFDDQQYIQGREDLLNHYHGCALVREFLAAWGT